jgi:hypothetical protein
MTGENLMCPEKKRRKRIHLRKFMKWMFSDAKRLMAGSGVKRRLRKEAMRRKPGEPLDSCPLCEAMIKAEIQRTFNTPLRDDVWPSLTSMKQQSTP